MYVKFLLIVIYVKARLRATAFLLRNVFMLIMHVHLFGYMNLIGGEPGIIDCIVEYIPRCLSLFEQKYNIMCKWNHNIMIFSFSIMFHKRFGFSLLGYYVSFPEAETVSQVFKSSL